MTTCTRVSSSACHSAWFSSRWSWRERALSFSGRLSVIRALPPATSYRIVSYALIATPPPRTVRSPGRSRSLTGPPLRFDVRILLARDGPAPGAVIAERPVPPGQRLFEAVLLGDPSEDAPHGAHGGQRLDIGAGVKGGADAHDLVGAVHCPLGVHQHLPVDERQAPREPLHGGGQLRLRHGA